LNLKSEITNLQSLDLRAAPMWVAAVSRVIRSLPAGRYRAMNWVARRKAAPFWAALPDDLGGLLFRCDLRDPLMREVCITGRYEPQETVLLQHLLQPGMTFVDVGANWGYFTLVGAHLVAPQGCVISVEADPSACRTLAANVEKNRLSHVTVIAAAASNVAARIRVRRYASQPDATSNFGVALADTFHPGDENGSTLEIAATPLDDVLDAQGIAHVDLLKMDIEGAEGGALRGLSRRLSRGAIDRVILELHPVHLARQRIAPESVVAALEADGYDAWSIDHSPSVHRRSASRRVDPRGLVRPLRNGAVPERQDLGLWPHLLFVRRGLSL
jgi:FkbM family methyltransferase